MTALIVTADDVGLHRGMNDGAIKAHREGIVTACSLVANGREFDHAVDLLKDNPRLEVGMHLTFVEERPLSSMRSFPKKWPGFLARYWALNVEKLAVEARMQIERVLAAGLPVTHLNSHQHLHVLPRVREIVGRLAEEYQIVYVRRPLDRGGESRRWAMRALGHLATSGTNDQTIGIADAGHLTAAKMLKLFDHLNGLTELVTHPGLGDIASSYDWGYDWEAETAALCDAGVREAVRTRGIVLTTPSRR